MTTSTQRLSDQLGLFANRGTTDNFERLVPDIRRAVTALLRVQDYVCWWHVRQALFQAGYIDGTEVIRGAGTFAKRCGLVAVKDAEGRVMAERPDEQYNKLFPKSHANRHTCYQYPRPPIADAITKVMGSHG